MNSPWQLRETARRLHGGATVAYPTEAVYGLGCDPLNPQAVARLLALKGRTAGKGLILIAADYNQLVPYLAPLSRDLAARVNASWPGPVTWVLPARAGVPWWLRGEHDGLAVRVTAHPLAAALCRAYGGPLVSTSANRSGHPAAHTALQVRCRFGDKLDKIIHGALGGRSRPSEIRDGLSGTVLRR